MSEGKSSSGCLFWIILGPLVIAPVLTFIIVGLTWIRPRSSTATPATPPEAAAEVSDAHVKQDGARICAAAATPDGGDPIDADSLWRKLGAPPNDPWGRAYEWQPWNRSVRSYGPDRARGTPDDQIVRCE
jgi:hypothetical protein